MGYTHEKVRQAQVYTRTTLSTNSSVSSSFSCISLTSHPRFSPIARNFHQKMGNFLVQQVSRGEEAFVSRGLNFRSTGSWKHCELLMVKIQYLVFLFWNFLIAFYKFKALRKQGSLSPHFFFSFFSHLFNISTVELQQKKSSLTG